MKNKTIINAGLPLSSLVFLVFLILKLAEIGAVANWSWWWVTCPLWAPIALVLAILAFIFIIGCIATLFTRRRRKKQMQKLKFILILGFTSVALTGCVRRISDVKTLDYKGCKCEFTYRWCEDCFERSFTDSCGKYHKGQRY